MKMERRTIGDLECCLVDQLPDDASPDLIVVLCHGYGAPGTDLVPLAGEVARLEPDLGIRTRFVFPAAPLSLDSVGLPGGRAWWHIQIENLFEMVARGGIRGMPSEFPEGMLHSRERMSSLLAEVREQNGVDNSQIVLGGFSQGAMIAIDTALRQQATCAGLAVMSGTLLCEPEWSLGAKKHQAMAVVQSHGRQDPLLPYESSLWLRDLFQEAGMTVDFHGFEGGHTIPLEALHQMARLLKSATKS